MATKIEYADLSMRSIILSDILELEVSERLELVEDIWDSIAAAPEAIQLTDAQRLELDRRLATYRNNPNSGSPWQLVKKRILDSK